MEIAMEIVPLAALKDNYIWRLAVAGNAVIIDPGAAAPVLQHLHDRQLRLSAILITHRHADHTAGLAEVVAATGAPVFGPGVIAGVSHPLVDGQRFAVPGLGVDAEVMAVPGHLHEHIAYRIGEHCFCGDTLFSAGCGRVFEGDPRTLFRSLQKLAALPLDTLLYPGHEYTLNNLAFAALVEPDNGELPRARQRAEALIQQGLATLPTTVQHELGINPFLRFNTSLLQSVQHHRGQRPQDEEELFLALRAWKNEV